MVSKINWNRTYANELLAIADESMNTFVFNPFDNGQTNDPLDTPFTLFEKNKIKNNYI